MEERMTDLEVKIAFVEHHVAQLDELVRKVAGRLDEMQAELASLREQLAEASKLGSPEEEVPPHHTRL